MVSESNAFSRSRRKEAVLILVVVEYGLGVIEEEKADYYLRS